MSPTQADTPRSRFRRGVPVTMLVLAGLIAAGYGLAHAAGLRENVSRLFATSGGSGDRADGVLLGGLYVLLHLLFTLGMPILLLAAGAFTGLELLLSRRREGPPPRRAGSISTEPGERTDRSCEPSSGSPR
ncbi:MAG TPA: hypothetical protein VM695_01895 [Phycisphaerae bacterium]|nr:hypothetical protein [Phycisphaerae bacterium]